MDNILVGVEVVLGLGSNLGDRNLYLEKTIERLIQLNIIYNVKRSQIIETEAFLLPGSPKEWDIKYLNMAVRGTCYLSPNNLLLQIKKIEQSLGRKPSQRYAPREIDIDILIYGNEVIKEEHLTIPHKHLFKREWALNPLYEVYPDWRKMIC
jgi:2-amino-4-hydroxy-6-hydroxymethyldihydropteridine diphosphokinase